MELFLLHERIKPKVQFILQKPLINQHIDLKVQNGKEVKIRKFSAVICNKFFFINIHPCGKIRIE